MSSIENSSFSRLLRISSVHSEGASGTPTNFSVNLSRMTETNNIARVVVKSVDFPNNFYNITELNNELTLEFSVDGVISIIPIPPGFYSTTDIIDYVVADINGQLTGGSIITMIQDPTTKIISFTVTLQTMKLYNLEDAPVTSSLSPCIGIEKTTAFLAGHTVDRIPNLYGVTKVYVHSLELAEGNLVDGDVEVHDIIAEVPVKVVWGAWNYYESNDDELDSLNYSSLRNLDNIKIQIKDLENNILDLKGGEFTITLKIYYIS